MDEQGVRPAGVHVVRPRRIKTIIAIDNVGSHPAAQGRAMKTPLRRSHINNSSQQIKISKYHHFIVSSDRYLVFSYFKIMLSESSYFILGNNKRTVDP